jgi:hypothetical protein
MRYTLVGLSLLAVVSLTSGQEKNPTEPRGKLSSSDCTGHRT